jgi:tripartite-type tricarboxylate transporter receptor subunit TctC
MFNGIGNVLPQLKTGKIRVYAIAAEQRSEFLPDVPTFKELGYPDLMSLVWMGLWAPPQVPATIVERLHAEVARILAQPATRQRFKEIGFTPAAPRRSDELARAVQADYQRAGAILRTLGVTPA